MSSSSNNCRCFFTTTSKIIPHTNSNIAIININPEKIKVGILGTKPVSKYSINTGTPNINAIIKKTKLISEKNMVGLYSLKSLAIVFKTLKPSL